MIIKPGEIVFDGGNTSYKIVEHIGQGAFGMVFKIQKETDGSIWVLKTLSDAFSEETILQSLINEGNLATKISHPNVIKYVFFHNGVLFEKLPLYIIMEYANQGTLEGLIQSRQPKKDFLNEAELINIFNQLIDGMEAINTHLIHRDIKPDNILIKDSVLKISDFGLSKIVTDKTRSQTFKGIGAIRYMSPEGWKKEKNTIQMDIYSMGIVFFKLATLSYPFNLADSADIAQYREAHLFIPPIRPTKINPGISNMVEQIILKMLEKSPSLRFLNWDEIRKALIKNELPHSTIDNYLEKIISRRITKDDHLRQEGLKAEKRTQEIKEFVSTVKYQLDKDILNPISNLITKFNQKYLDGKMEIIQSRAVPSAYVPTFQHLIRLASGQLIVIEIQPLIDEEFMKNRQVNDYGRIINVKNLQRPTLHNKKILAWGYIHNQFDQGHNLVLIEKEGEIYGEWFFLTSTNNALSSQGRSPEPFYFKFNELAEEVVHVGSMHIYDTKVEPLQELHLYQFFEENI